MDVGKVITSVFTVPGLESGTAGLIRYCGSH